MSAAATPDRRDKYINHMAEYITSNIMASEQIGRILLKQLKQVFEAKQKLIDEYGQEYYDNVIMDKLFESQEYLDSWNNLQQIIKELQS